MPQTPSRLTASPSGPRVRLAASLTVLGLLAPAVVSAQTTVRADPLDLPFSSFFRRPIGPRGLDIGDALREADGRVVRLTGYMVAQEAPTVDRFLLTPRPVRMSDLADGEADDLPPATVTVLLDSHPAGRTVAHRPGLISVSGRLQVGREEEPSGRVSWVRLYLDPAALAEEGSRPTSHPIPSPLIPTQPNATLTHAP